MRSIFSIFFLFSFNAYSQVGSAPCKRKALEGTYQLIISDVKRQPYFFTEESLCYFESLRLENSKSEIQLSDNVTLFLPSKEELESKFFVPLQPIRYLE